MTYDPNDPNRRVDAHRPVDPSDRTTIVTETYVEPVERKASPLPLIIGIVLALALAYFVMQRFMGGDDVTVETTAPATTTTTTPTTTAAPAASTTADPTEAAVPTPPAAVAAGTTAEASVTPPAVVTTDPAPGAPATPEQDAAMGGMTGMAGATATPTPSN